MSHTPASAISVERTKPSTTAIVIVDVQEKLVRTMPPEAVAQVERAAKILLGAAKELSAPCIVTEQYPKGLGPTVPAIRALLEDDASEVPIISKLTFSACNEPQFVQELKGCRADAAVVLGMETHICVFQTVRDLVARGLRVDVVSDGVCSRREDHRQVGLSLCEKAGANVTTAETVLFDWMVQAGTDTFRTLSRLVR